MSKINPVQKELKINPELKKIIKEMLEKDAKLSQDKTVELIVESKKIRLPESAIKSGVEAYFGSLVPPR